MDETIQQALEAELTRLLTLDLSPEEEEIARRYYSQKERDSMPASSFCGPHKSFPVTSQADVSNAAHLVGHADNPDAVKACIKRKAKANGWKLPDSWSSDGDGDDGRSLESEIERAKQAAAHPPFTGRHNHGHPHDMDGYAHEHSHEHANDNMHDHTHTHHRAAGTDVETHLYVPITRIDKEQWIVEGQATSDAVDHYNTVFDYESSKRAFNAWRGNIREMHDPKKAVGRAVEVVPDDDSHAINVRARISKGARDTWEKVLDGTLSGFSIGVPAGKYKVKEVQRNGKNVPMYYDHELAEVSLVDNPGSPGCNIAVVRADGIATDVLDNSEADPLTQADDLNRAGSRISHATQSQLHDLRDGHLQGVAKAIAICICDECMALSAILDADQDGDIDVVNSLDLDGDGGTQPMQGSMNYNVEAAITRNLNPLITRVNAMLSSYASRAIHNPQVIPEFSTEPLERRIEAVETSMKTDIAEVRSLLSEVKGLAEKIAAQPMPGGPVMTPVDKRLATSPQQYNAAQDIEALQRAAQLTQSNDAQVALAAELIKRQNRG